MRSIRSYDEICPGDKYGDGILFRAGAVPLCSPLLTGRAVVDGVLSRVFGIRGGATNSGGMDDGNRLVIAAGRLAGRLVGRLVGRVCGLLDCCISSWLIRLFLACCCQKSDCCICEYEAAAANR